MNQDLSDISLRCPHCKNTDKKMLELLVDSPTTRIIYCVVCSKTTYVGKEKDGKDNR